MHDVATGLRIAHVQPLSLDLYGHDDRDFGTRTRYFLTNIAMAQARTGDRPSVHLMTSGRELHFRVEGVDVHFHRCVQPPRRAPVGARFAHQFSPGMLRALRPDRADVVHFHGIRSLQGMFGAVAWIAGRQRLPLVGQDHGPRRVGPVMTMVQRYALRNTAVALAANRDSVDALSAMGMPRESIVVVPNGVDHEIFTPSMERPLRPGDPLRVLVVARFWEDKDPLTMAEGVAGLAATGRAVQVTLVGGGPLRPETEARLRSAGVPVEAFDHLTAQELAAQYRAADVLVLTSLREGFNQVTIEAMACGLPVVATDIPGIRDGVGDAGILIPPRDPGALTGSLEALISVPGSWMHYRKLGIARARKFEWDAIAVQIRDAYARALANAHTPEVSAGH